MRQFVDYLALKASAGSGKTFALSVRYIALILKGESIKSITALTFTKKAANEMSERIINTFLDLDKPSRKGELDTICALLEISAKDAIKRRDKYLKDFLTNELKIMTFDSFFGMILRLFALHAGVSPEYETSQNEAKDLQSKMIDEISKKNNILHDFALYINEYDSSKGNFFKTLSSFDESIAELSYKQTTKPSSDTLMAKVKNMHEYINSLDNASTHAKKAFGANSVNEYLKSTVASKTTLNGEKTYSKIYSNELEDMFCDIKQECKKYADELEAYQLGRLSSIFEIYKNVKTRLLQQNDTLTFCDVTNFVSKLLADDNFKHVLYFRLDSKIKHLLIDEFQDTNVIQYGIISPLISEIVAGKGQTDVGSFFYVGDTKQSIYRFRGGKKELFDKVINDFSHISLDTLDTNYRSSKTLVNYVNSVFAHPVIKNYKPQIPDKKDEGYIKVVSSDEIIDQAVIEVENLLNSGVRVSDIAVLCWQNDDSDMVCERLRLKNIAYTSESNVLLKNSPLVFALINYAKFCLFDTEIYARNFSAFMGKMPVKIELDLDKTAKENLIYLAKRAEISLQDSDILRLLEIANGDLIGFIFELEHSQVKATKSKNGGVQVMTVFKSKGLEFKHVVLCDLVGRGSTDKDKFIVDYDINEGMMVKLKVANRACYDDEYAKFMLAYEQKIYEEDINKIYVAMTRAKMSLIIVKKQNPNGNSPSYFTEYGKENDEIKYVCLQECEVGKVTPNNDQIPQPKPSKKIQLALIQKDDQKSANNDEIGDLNAVYFGLALHFLLEMCAKFSKDEILAQTHAMKNKFAKFLTKDELDDVVSRAISLCENKQFNDIIKDCIVKKEQTVCYNDEIKQFDLLCIRQNEMVVIDYKSALGDSDKYVKQVSGYVRILQNIYPDYKISGAIFYALKDEILVKRI
ncbi:RecB-like helicase [Campylobacter majalis]|uniref:RecB-like helicase n=1 Tax=Campylobacter majalis TaxID=2790656 RepID=UPI003D68898A